jgi:hypothetical protein
LDVVDIRRPEIEIGRSPDVKGMPREEVDRALEDHFRRQYVRVITNAGRWEVKAEVSLHRKVESKPTWDWPEDALLVSSNVTVICSACETPDDKGAFDLLEKDPEISVYFAEQSAGRVLMTQGARQTAERLAKDFPKSIYAGYCHFALAMNSRARGISGWEEEAARHYRAVLDADNNVLKPRCLVHVAEIEQKRDKKKAMALLAQAASLNSGCYYGYRIIQLQGFSPPRPLAHLKVPQNKLLGYYTIQWNGEFFEKDVFELARRAGLSPDPTKSYFSEGLADSTTNFLVYCNQMPLKYVLSWLGQLSGLKYEVEGDVSAHDCCRETEGPWREDMIRRLDQPISIAVSNVAFGELIPMMAKLTGVSIVVDPSARVTGDNPINLAIDSKGEKAAEVLTKTLNQAKLHWRLQGCAVFICP